MSKSSFTQKELIQIFKGGGVVFGEACDYIASIVPSKLIIDNTTYTHFPSYFQPKTMCFAYCQNLTGEFKSYTLEEIRAQIEKHKQID